MTDVDTAVAGALARWGGSEAWGLCALVASDIADDLGGTAVMVGGYLIGPDCRDRDFGCPCPRGRRSHWWVEFHGRVIDPLADLLGAEVQRHERDPEALSFWGVMCALVNAKERGINVSERYSAA